MHADSEFDEVVLFELPSTDEAQRLWLRLQGTRLAWLHRRDDSLFVAVALRAETGDLARLLREVEAWVADCGLPYVPFELDGRCYELRARREALAGNAAA
jgi:hypothetical protein